MNAKKLFFILFLCPHILFAQTENQDYELYTLVLTERHTFGKGAKDDSLVLIKKLPQKSTKRYIDFSLIEEVDSYENPYWGMLYTDVGKNSVFLKRIIEDPELKETFKSLEVNFDDQVKLRTNLFLEKNIRIKKMSWTRYYSLHFPKSRRNNMWKKIKRKFGAKYVFMFSKVVYHGKYAAFYCGYYCGSLCGSGDVIVFENVEGEWKMLGSLNKWMS